MSAKARRIAKNIAKNGAWAIGDIIFLGLKAMLTVILIAATTAAMFLCVFLFYLNDNLTSGLDVNPQDFDMTLSSAIYYVDRETGEEIELVTLQSTEYRRWVNYDEIPQHLINALISIEDHRFFQHNGVDWYRTAGAFSNMFLGMRDTFGGSTITQQLIKNLTHEDDVTVQRKLQEIFRAIEYERMFAKEEILELYLNLVYFGHGCYGIGAAAHHYFGKEVVNLTLAESASIVGITNNPSKYSPYADREANKDRQEIILKRMYALGYITSAPALERALNAPLNFQRGVDDAFEQIIYTWFEEAVIRDVITDMVDEYGYSEQWARRLVYTGGLRIIATIDLEMQEIVDNIYENRDLLPNVTGSAQPLQSGIVLADPYTGEILALSGGTGIKTRNLLLNRATSTRRPPGSSLKPLSAYAPAMEAGLLTPDTLYDDSEYVTLEGTTWMPRNANRDWSGIITVRTALVRSTNTIAAVVVDQLTPARSYRFLRDSLGFALHPADEDYAPLAAGQLTHGATVREMASGFTIFPNSGIRTTLRTYSRVYNQDGSILINNTPGHVRAINQVTADWMTSMLYDAVVSGTGSAANLGRSMPTAGKTGTSTDNRDRWFVGYTPYYIAAVWTGFDTPATMRTNGNTNPAAQIWKMVMEPIHEGLDTRSFNIPDEGSLPPVIGVELTDYVMRCVDANGDLIHETIVPIVIGREIVITAPDIEGFLLISESERTIVISPEWLNNIVVFIYEAEIPDDPDPYDPYYPYDPYDPYDPFDPYDPYDPFDPFDPLDPFDPDNPADLPNPFPLPP